MKKISFLIVLLFSVASSQLRIGINTGRSISIGAPSAVLKEAGVPKEIIDATDDPIDGMGLTVGYEKMLPIIGLLGVGVEYSMGGDDGEDILFGYAVGKLPVFPLFKGIVKAGYSIPMGDTANDYGAGLGIGFGLGFKAPFIPIGAEILYSAHMLKSNDDGVFSKVEGLDPSYSSINLRATYKF